MKAITYNQEGKETGSIELSEKVFDVKYNGDLVHQVLVSLTSNARLPFAHAKDRSEVRGGGKKPWRQKGTGRARHGSNRSPIWAGGGVTHGPLKDRNFKKKINAKMKKKALFAALSAKLRDKEILFIEDLSFDEPKTAGAKDLLGVWANILKDERVISKKKNAIRVLSMDEGKNLSLSFRNLKNVDVSDIRNTNLLDVLSHKYLVISKANDSVAFLEGKTL